MTHALLSRSPGIDAGNNILVLPFDQRGTPHLRASAPTGNTAVPDIGAYEVDRSEVIFNATFDGCT